MHKHFSEAASYYFPVLKPGSSEFSWKKSVWLAYWDVYYKKTGAMERNLENIKILWSRCAVCWPKKGEDFMEELKLMNISDIGRDYFIE